MELQAWILRSFLVQLETKEAAGEEAPDGIAEEFAMLKSQSIKYRTDKTYPTKTAEKQENIKKNRYKDIVPFDHSRVKLTFTTSKNDSDYINASFIKGVSGSRAYIATQGPLPHTVLDFLRMLWEYNTKVVVMACREFELGKKKCERYWPQKEGQPFVCQPFTVYCDSEENKGDYVSRTLRLTYRNCSRTLKQLHYTTWPDHGVPDSIPTILELLDEMRSNQEGDDTPICIHCSAGCGRTGALCVIDYTWNLLKRQMIPPDFNIYNLVQDMRTQRPSLVQTKEQYELVYKTIRLLFESYLQSLDAQAQHKEEIVVASAIRPDSQSEELDLLPQFQQMLKEERDVLPHYQTPSPSLLDNVIDMTDKDLWGEQQPWNFVQSLSEAQVASQELQEEPNPSSIWVQTSPRDPAEENSIEESNSMPSLHQPPSATVCLTVEDPYFDTVLSSPSSEEAPPDSENVKQCTVSPIFSTPSLCLNDQLLELNPPASGTVDSDEETPPPLPQRTPDSYLLAEDKESSDPGETLLVVIPPNAAAEAVRELGGRPTTPTPPLPERTPESFEIATDQAPVKQTSEVQPAVNLSRLGLSSEWCGNSNPAVTASHKETKPWARSRSLRARLTFSVALPDLTSNSTTNLHPHSSPPDSLPSLPLPKPEESLARPLPGRTPETFVLSTEDIHKKTALCPPPQQAPDPSSRIGSSSEWDGASQPKKFLDIVRYKSKSVRAKSSKPEPLTALPQFSSAPVATVEGGSVHVNVNHTLSLNTEMSGNHSDKGNDKGFSRSKSLKFFKHKQKPKIAPPSPPTQPRTPPPTNSTASSMFMFGFGNRFGKPKGPRSYPQTWV